MDAQVHHRPEVDRFEVVLDGEVVGVADYEDRGGVRSFTHTWVEPAHRGAGLAGRLVDAALDEAAGSGRRIVPLCSFVADHVRSHPEYAALVAD